MFWALIVCIYWSASKSHEHLQRYLSSRVVALGRPCSLDLIQSAHGGANGSEPTVFQEHLILRLFNILPLWRSVRSIRE